MASAQTIKLLHYHITNLDSVKIDSDAKQVGGAGKIINGHTFDILSLNGIQYDFKGVPSENFETTGLNVEKLIDKWGLERWNYFFTPSNLGVNAKTKADGSYFVDSYSPEAMAHADDLNFATMPGQLSTGGVFRHKILERKVFTDLVWKAFNPRVDFGRFRTMGGANIPEDMKLFDKSFSDITLDVSGKSLHLIQLHAAPSFGFGNPHSINSFRNAEQLRFLEWYVSGETEYAVDILGITPLEKDDYFIIVGDLNVDINSRESEGSAVLHRIIEKSTPWMKPLEMAFTNEATHFAPNPFRLVLDYLIVSRNIDVLDGRVIHPDFTRVELGSKQKPGDSPEGKSVVAYEMPDAGLVSGKSDSQQHYVMVDDEYLRFKDTSYHYPIYGEFRLR